MKYVKLWLLTLVCSCGSHSPRVESIETLDQEAGVLDNPRSAVMALERDGKVFCSGVAIRDGILLTAAHCFLNDRSLNKLHIRGADGQRYPVQEIMTYADRLDRVEEAFLPNYDIAMVRFSDDVPGRWIKLASGAQVVASEGHVAWIAGYGRSDDHPTGHYHLGATRIKKVYRSGMRKGVITVDNTFGSAPCSGDSGGPLLMQKKGEWWVLGVTHGVHWFSNPDYFGSDGCQFPEASFASLSLHPEVNGQDQVSELSAVPDDRVELEFLGYCEDGMVGRGDVSLFKALLLQFKGRDCESLYGKLASDLSFDLLKEPVYSLKALALLPRIDRLSIDLRLLEDLPSLPPLREMKVSIGSQDDLDWVFGNRHLTSLELTDAPRGLQWDGVGQLHELGTVILMENNIVELPSLSGLKKLRTLNVLGNHLDNLDFIRDNYKITHLLASSNQIEDLAGLVNHSDLKVVLLGNNRISQILDLASATSLEYLSLVNNEIPLHLQLCPTKEQQQGSICAF
ncbi:trypsin-like serine protease [Pseudobacteriovorax antillogorgiicola]|uniref:Trypsin n=1 Tax=Pseudobacteriovorax antillogorgiicola TaxID=1513793 RepID=A0A1Y6BH28_9BACT|nr:trypsin-like serine protease [Pseudobacteriovorax antillogorgiicola]TCS57280.1 trypsin [Pseudobacteriovorax antillogorgiicola]SMF03126.1 Trypsin [Pseudobacteriovorax antillogorgiicola]